MMNCIINFKKLNNPINMQNFIIKESLAQDSSQSNTKQEFSIVSFTPIILIMVVFYLLIIRPQNKKYKEQKEMIENLKIGNNVITSSGIIGTIRNIDNKKNQIELEITQGVSITILKQYIQELVKNEEDNLLKKK